MLVVWCGGNTVHAWCVHTRNMVQYKGCCSQTSIKKPPLRNEHGSLTKVWPPDRRSLSRNLPYTYMAETSIFFNTKQYSRWQLNRIKNNTKSLVGTAKQWPQPLNRSGHLKQIWFAVLNWLCTNTWLIIAVMHTTFKAVVKLKYEKKKISGLNGIRAYNLCDNGALLYQPSYQAIWKLVTLWVCNTPGP